MSCYITYNNKNYTEKDFKEYLKSVLAEKQNESKEDPKQEIINNYYEGDIVPEPNTVFVFGSNPEGRHGAGAAKIAKDKFGAIYGQGEGLQGKAYALPTKDLRIKENKGFKSISPSEIIESIKKLYQTAMSNPTKQFKVAYRNTTTTSLNGYTGLEMIEMFKQAGPIPSNIVFSKEWYDVISKETSSQVGQTFNNETSTDTYQYYGTKYEIITVDGVGVQVKNYKGSHQNQQKLLQAYNNNKDIDPQTGRNFRTSTSGQLTQSPQSNQKAPTPTPKQPTVITPEMIRARVKSSFDKNGYMDIKEENRGDKVILGAITRYIMATKGITTNNQIIEANKTFKLKDEVTLETVKEGVLRIKIKEDIVEETPKPLGGLNMSKLTSSGESMANDALSNVEQAFKCK